MNFQMIEAFGAGTAAVVSPIKTIAFHEKVLDLDISTRLLTNVKDYPIPIDKELGIGKLTKRFADTIMGIQVNRFNFKCLHNL